MAWVAPTIIDLKIRFPEFDAVADSTLQAILDEAVQQVGDTWVERDRTPAIQYLAAHMLASQGLGLGGSGSSARGPIKRRKVGDVETEFAGSASASGGSGSDYGLTMYGQAFQRLLRRNFPAVAVA